MKFFIFFFFIPVFYTNAQIDSIFISDFNDALKVSADFYTSPLQYDSKDWITFSSVVGLTALSTLADKEVKNYSQNNQSKFVNNFLTLINIID
ncbi:MAG: hypothetical protein IPH97_00200 [Ignavibacteriales bacterium]|nr:hypothetical protein [Ignavibacteriales bacterium]